MGTLNSERWPGVSSGLDEDERREKVKQRVAMELEEKKEAVENDDKSICWQQQTGQTLDTYKFTDEKKNTWKSMILELEAKQLKAGKWLVTLTRVFLTFSLVSKMHTDVMFTEAAN